MSVNKNIPEKPAVVEEIRVAQSFRASVGARTCARPRSFEKKREVMSAAHSRVIVHRSSTRSIDLVVGNPRRNTTQAVGHV